MGEYRMNIENILRQHGITSLYHFTDRSNLATIELYGLQSLENIIQKHIAVSHFGADSLSHDLDRNFGLHHFVHLSFIQDHPMYHVAKSRGSIVDPVWLEIDISVLFANTTCVSDKVANRNGAKFFNVHNMDMAIDFDAMCYGQDFNMRKEARKAEILVFNEIETSKIIGVYNGK